MLGTGTPFGFTLPARSRLDPRLARVFGVGGLRPLLLAELGAVLAQPSENPGGGTSTSPGMLQVLPPAAESPAKTSVVAPGLFRGRYVVHSASHPRGGEGVDALQIEVSAVLRDSPEATGAAIGRALVASLLRSGLPPSGAP